ncbi:DMT family transporter [Rheinheimera sp. 4Y26]|uniref:DMT family transporter n=1 Tax=Rheinheimera sp. 4Y26 TaxID=2977811 RepID=UPI0021B12ADD|nr:DMT family transporter [Rheinheimera sp. 4Y26]MCT6699815.1 DMT family transporter [Rheinheimera sp. 4Y26]
MTTATTNPEWPGLWRMLVAMLLSGTIGWFVVESGQNTATVVFYRCLIGGAALLLYLSWQHGWQQLNRSQAGYLLLGGLALVANWFCLFGAYHLSSISIATLVYHTQPFFLLLITALLQRQPPSASRWAWLALAFCGVALTTGLQFGGDHQQLWLGVGLAALAACLYAVATLTTRKLSGVAPAQIAGLQMMLGVLLMLPMDKTSLSELALPSAAALLTLGLVHTGLMYNLMYSAFQRLPVSSIAFLSFVYPLVAVLIDLWFYQVALSLLQVGGMALIVLAIVANQRQWAFWPFTAQGERG